MLSLFSPLLISSHLVFGISKNPSHPPCRTAAQSFSCRSAWWFSHWNRASQYKMWEETSPSNSWHTHRNKDLWRLRLRPKQPTALRISYKKDFQNPLRRSNLIWFSDSLSPPRKDLEKPCLEELERPCCSTVPSVPCLPEKIWRTEHNVEIVIITPSPLLNTPT